MCSSGSLADIQAYYGFKISTNTISSGVLANFLNIYYINQNSTFNSIASNISVSPILTVLNDSKCSCQNVLYKVIF